MKIPVTERVIQCEEDGGTVSYIRDVDTVNIFYRIFFSFWRYSTNWGLALLVPP
jgi:hypothetical protein